MFVEEDSRQAARQLALAGNISGLLQAADRGNDQAASELYRLVEQDLKQIARKRKRAYGAEGAVSTTVLVEDAFCRLVGRQATVWEAGDRRKFFGYASRKILDLLIDELHKQGAEKRRGAAQAVELVPDGAPAPGQAEHLDSLIDLRDALARLEQSEPDNAALFRIRFFLDCTFDEAAGITGLSKTEAVRRYQRVTLWLRRELKDYAASMP